MIDKETLYTRVGGYDGIVAVADDFLPRLMTDPQLGRFWAHRGADGVAREKQLMINLVCTLSGGPVLYAGRDNRTSHTGMRITSEDWAIFIGHLGRALDKAGLAAGERTDMVALFESTRGAIVE